MTNYDRMKNRTQHVAKGFTLIEVLVSFFLLLLIVGVGALSLTTESNKQKLAEPATELQTCARKGLQLAIVNRRAFAVSLGENSFALREANVREETGSSLLGDDEASGGIIESHELDEDMHLEVRRWGDKYFRTPEKDEHYLWVFEPSGICEPLAIRLIHTDGMVEMEFNPLTAKLQGLPRFVLGSENLNDL